MAMHRKGRNDVKDGEAVAWAAPLLQDHRAGRAAMARSPVFHFDRRKAVAFRQRPFEGDEKMAGLMPRRCGYPNAASCASAVLRSSEAPWLSTLRSKGFHISPTTCS